jgi:hypothetical protein
MVSIAAMFSNRRRRVLVKREAGPEGRGSRAES